MSTPAMAFGVGLRNVVVSFWMVWGATFLISRLDNDQPIFLCQQTTHDSPCFLSRVFLLHEAYVSESNKRVDEKWLLLQCQVLS